MANEHFHILEKLSLPHFLIQEPCPQKFDCYLSDTPQEFHLCERNNTFARSYGKLDEVGVQGDVQEDRKASEFASSFKEKKS